MRALLEVEAWCAAVVERAFARAFPGALEPVQIARRLVATVERDPPHAEGDGVTRYVVRISAGDFARLSGERALLEQQWARMAAVLSERAGHTLAAPPVVVLAEDRGLVIGTVVVDVVAPSGVSPRPSGLRLRVEAGVARGASIVLPRSGDAAIVVGRDAGCDLVVPDPRISRRHIKVATGQSGVHFEDLESSNGTFHNGERKRSGALRSGDRLALGDTPLAVEPQPSEP